MKEKRSQGFTQGRVANFNKIGQSLKPAACPKIFGHTDRHCQILAQLKLKNEQQASTNH